VNTAVGCKEDKLNDRAELYYWRNMRQPARQLFVGPSRWADNKGRAKAIASNANNQLDRSAPFRFVSSMIGRIQMSSRRSPYE
jgi:hypothetical protein